jgi:hypothetical protein
MLFLEPMTIEANCYDEGLLFDEARIVFSEL